MRRYIAANSSGIKKNEKFMAMKMMGGEMMKTMKNILMKKCRVRTKMVILIRLTKPKRNHRIRW